MTYFFIYVSWEEAFIFFTELAPITIDNLLYFKVRFFCAAGTSIKMCYILKISWDSQHHSFTCSLVGTIFTCHRFNNQVGKYAFPTVQRSNQYLHKCWMHNFHLMKVILTSFVRFNVLRELECADDIRHVKW